MNSQEIELIKDKSIEVTKDNPLYSYMGVKSKMGTNSDLSMQRMSTMHGRKHSFVANQSKFTKMPLKTRPQTINSQAGCLESSIIKSSKIEDQRLMTSISNERGNNVNGGRNSQVSQKSTTKTPNYNYMNNW